MARHTGMPVIGGEINMFDLKNSLKKQSGKISQPLLISLVIGATVLLSIFLILTGKNKSETSDEHAEEEGEKNMVVKPKSMQKV